MSPQDEARAKGWYRSELDYNDDGFRRVEWHSPDGIEQIWTPGWRKGIGEIWTNGKNRFEGTDAEDRALSVALISPKVLIPFAEAPVEYRARRAARRRALEADDV